MPFTATCLQEITLQKEGEWLPRACACSQELAAVFPLFSLVSDQIARSCRLMCVYSLSVQVLSNNGVSK
jgi:hypothetical protein